MYSTIERTLADQEQVIWDSSVTAALVGERRARQHSDVFPSTEGYSTSEYLLGIGNKPCWTFFVNSFSTPLTPELRIECLHPCAEAKFSAKGLSFVAYDDPSWPDISQSILKSAHLIALNPNLAKSVALLVRSLHILSVDDPAFDTSFSEPFLPFSIFTNVAGSDTNSSMRAAEAIIHEAMHLQLTLVEQLTPIVNGIERSHYSPWKEESRPTSGLIHAMYVFSVIDRWLESAEAIISLRAYASRRREEINHEMSMVDAHECFNNASNVGQIILRKIFDRFSYR